jgi:hypothetical protein
LEVVELPYLEIGLFKKAKAKAMNVLCLARCGNCEEGR